MIPPVYALLSGASAVTGIVADRIGAHGQVLPTETRPYVTWQMVSGAGELVLDKGRAPDDRVSVQVDCYHTSAAGLRALADAVRTALESDSYYTGLIADERDAETALYRLGMQFDFILT